MKTLIRTLVSAIFLGLVYVGNALAVDIQINPGAYTGNWSVDYGPVQRGPAVVSLGAMDPVIGSHLISISGAELFFRVNPGTGRVSVITRGAASGGKRKLTFKTVSITVDPGFFTGKWRITQGATSGLMGLQSIDLVAGLKHYDMKVGANGGFTFHLGNDGMVTVKNALAGSGGHGILRFNNTERFISSAMQ